MIKLSFAHVLICLVVLASMAFMKTANAQEIEIANDYYYLRSKNAASTIYGFPSGDIIIAGGTNTLFTTVVSSNSAMGLRVLNNWNHPAAFEVYGSGVWLKPMEKPLKGEKSLNYNTQNLKQ